VAAKSGLLTIDGGNSTLDCRSHGSGGHLLLYSAADPVAALTEFAEHSRAQRAVAVCVVDTARTAVEAAMRAAAMPVRFAGIDISCPLPLAYDTPDTLGADRWVSALAAHREHGRCVVIDCGTATTVNLVEEDGTFRGGPIGPGLRAFTAGMAVVTPALPAPDLDAEVRMPAPTTQAAVDAGVLLGYCGLVERLTADMQRAAAGPAKVVITGGNAERVLARSRLCAAFVPDLVHRGLALLDSQP